MVRNRKRSSIRRIALGCNAPTVDEDQPLDNSIITNNYRQFNRAGLASVSVGINWPGEVSLR